MSTAAALLGIAGAALGTMPAGMEASRAQQSGEPETVAQIPVPEPVITPAKPLPIDMLLFGLVLLTATIWILPLARRVVDFVAPPQEVVHVPWGLGHIALVALFLVAVPQLMGLLHLEPDLLTQLVLSASAFGLCTAAAISIAAACGRVGMHAFGLRTNGNLRSVVAGVGLYVVCLPGYYGVANLWAWFSSLFGHAVQGQEIVEMFSGLEPGERLVPVLIAVLIQPFFEEALFRGFLQPLLVQFLRPVAGIVLTSVLFAALHGFEAFLPLFALSLILGWVRQRTQRLSASWAVHGLHNGAQLSILYMLPRFVDL